MVEREASAASFLFTANAVSSGTFEVARFKGTDAISTPYSFEIELRSAQDSIAPQDLVGTAGTLLFFRDGQFLPYSGIISQFKYAGRTTDYCRYHATLVSRLWLLTLTVRSKIYQQMSVPDIVRQVLDDAGLNNYYTVNCGNHPQREFVMQYDESNFNFINRLMEESGIWYFFTEAPLPQSSVNAASTEQMIIADGSAAFNNIAAPFDISYRSFSGLVEGQATQVEETIGSMSLEKKIIPSDITLKNYNYRTPNVNISANRAVPNGVTGSQFQFGGAAKNLTDLSTALDVVRERLASSHTVASGEGDCRGFRAGNKFQLIDPPRQDLSGFLLITSVTHEGHCPDASDKSQNYKGYRNTFDSLTSAFSNSFRPQIKTPKPRINGIVTAQIEAKGSQYADIDDQGRYKVRLPFDSAQSPKAQGSKFIRMAQNYSGPNYGIHFPAHDGVEMLLGCIQGDPDKLVGLGTVPNTNNLSPVNNQNYQESVIRTAGGNEIILDDTDQKQKISIKTNANNNLLFDDDNQKIVIQSTADNKLVIDDKNKIVTINAAQNTFSLSYDSNGSKITLASTNGNSIVLDDQNKCIELHTPGGHKVIMDDQNNVLTLTDDNSTNEVTLDRNAGISMRTQQAISINATGDFNLQAANITLQSNGNLNASAASDLSLQGTNVNVNADAKATINGTSDMEVTGGMVKVDASSMGEVKAGGILTVQGAAVNIN
jgi:type VI secretion system secreted protein VgrG